ncbi:MAG: hypothetical protein P8L18_03830 [Verrucomicrobiota bacterium]|nr:hypothetical protein [Verrucomicrobiota bacterium]
MTFIAGCSGDKTAGNMHFQWEADGRSYTAEAMDDQGVPWVRLTCRYLGKAPEQPIEQEISRDWRSQNTDFYHYEMTNLLEEDITLMDMSLRLKKGKGGRIYETRGQPAIEKELSGFVLERGGSLKRRNSWVFGKAGANVLHKIYTARAGDRTIKIDTHLVYQR